MGALALGFGVASQIVGAVQTADANAQAKKSIDQETQLLAEAHQQSQQQQDQLGLIATRTSQENSLNPPVQKFNAGQTIKTSPLGIEAPDSGVPKTLLGT